MSAPIYSCSLRILACRIYDDRRWYKIGRYEIRSKIGEGGMGEVHLAQDTKLDRKVALKVLPADVAVKQESRATWIGLPARFIGLARRVPSRPFDGRIRRRR